MKLKRHFRSIAFGILFGLTFSVLTEDAQPFLLMTIAFAGVLIPNIDVNFITKHTNSTQGIFVNLFLMPFLIMLLIPINYVSAFFIGYYGHVVNDMDKKNNIDFAVQRAFTGLLWILAIMIIMIVFKLNFNQTMRLFG